MNRHSRTTKRVIYLLVLTLVLLPFGLVSGAHMKTSSGPDSAEMLDTSAMPHCQQQANHQLPQEPSPDQPECCVNLAQANTSEESCCADPCSYTLSTPLGPQASGLQSLDGEHLYVAGGSPFVPKPFVFPFLRPPLPISNL